MTEIPPLQHFKIQMDFQLLLKGVTTQNGHNNNTAIPERLQLRISKKLISKCLFPLLLCEPPRVEFSVSLNYCSYLQRYKVDNCWLHRNVLMMTDITQLHQTRHDHSSRCECHHCKIRKVKLYLDMNWCEVGKSSPQALRQVNEDIQFIMQIYRELLDM